MNTDLPGAATILTQGDLGSRRSRHRATRSRRRERSLDAGVRCETLASLPGFSGHRRTGFWTLEDGLWTMHRH